MVVNASSLSKARYPFEENYTFSFNLLKAIVDHLCSSTLLSAENEKRLTKEPKRN
jgi:hypothetical protein